jgi:hypothetical protein
MKDSHDGKMALGVNTFKKLVTESEVFVDKTLFIKEIIDSAEEAILITRPRRWGKTLNLDMLRIFFAIEVDEQGNKVSENSNKVLFKGGDCSVTKGDGKQIIKQLPTLKIAAEVDRDNDGYVQSYQGHYPVIYINFKDVRENTFAEVEIRLKNLIKDLYKEHKYLKYSSKLDDGDKEDYQKYIDQNYHGISFKSAIKFLSELLHRHFSQLVYILIDEYDKPVNHLLEHDVDGKNIEAISQTGALLSDIFSACGKDNRHLNKIVMTGIFDALKKEGNSGFNNLCVFKISDAQFSNHFGFSETEINEMLEKLKFTDNVIKIVKQNIKEWYNGYRVPLGFGEVIEAYTPWSVMNHLRKITKIGIVPPESYWEKSGVDWVLEKLSIDSTTLERMKELAGFKVLNFANPRHALIQLVESRRINEEILTYLLLNSGYLTLAEKRGYQIPNQEVLLAFREEVIKKWVEQELKGIGDANLVIKKLHDTLMNQEDFANALQELILNKIPFGDKSEAYFQSLIGGIIELYYVTSQSQARYQVIVEKTVSKAGRIDNIFYPVIDSEGGVIIHEYKKLSRTNLQNVSQTLKEGFWQILEKGYLKEPLAKKAHHVAHHQWDSISIRSIVCYQDETNGKWSAKIEEKSLDIKEAEKVVNICGDRPNKNALLKEFKASDVYDLIDKIKEQLQTKKRKADIGSGDNDNSWVSKEEARSKKSKTVQMG